MSLLVKLLVEKQDEQPVYLPNYKKSIDGNTLFQKSLSRQPKDTPPDTTLIDAFEERSGTPTPQRLDDRMSFFTRKKQISNDWTKLEEEEVEEKKFPDAGGPSTKGIPTGIVANYIQVEPVLMELSEVVTKKNFNKMVLESRIIDGKWSLSQADMIAVLKRDFRFKEVVKEKLTGYKEKPETRLIAGLKKSKAAQEDEFYIEQTKRESKWKPDCNNLCFSKETYQLQPLLDHGNIDGYSLETVQADGTADFVLTKSSSQIDPISWSEKLLLPVFLPIEAKSSFMSGLNSKKRQHAINGLSGHPNCAAFISLYQYDIESYPCLFAVILAKKIEVLLRYITISKYGVAMISYTPTINKVTGMLTKIKLNASMENVVKAKDVVVRSINDFTAEQLENPEWIIQKFIAWADLTSTVTIADFQSDSLTTQTGNLGEELTSIVFHSVTGAISRQGESITYDRVDLWMVKGDAEISISCKTVRKIQGNFKEWAFPLSKEFEGKQKVPVSFERSCDLWTATVHSDLIEPNFITLKAPEGTHWIVFVFTKSHLKHRLGSKTEMYIKC